MLLEATVDQHEGNLVVKIEAFGNFYLLGGLHSHTFQYFVKFSIFLGFCCNYYDAKETPKSKTLNGVNWSIFAAIWLEQREYCETRNPNKGNRKQNQEANKPSK